MRPAGLSSIVVIALAMAGNATAQVSAVKEEKPGLLAQATVTPDSAKATALRAVAKGGTIREAEIEQEDGVLVYSFDIKLPGRKGIEEVLVDAKTGKVVKVEHEDAAAESAEEKKDAAKKPPTVLR